MSDEISTISELGDILNAGVTETSNDGVTTKFDLKHVERRRAQLKRQYWAGTGKKRHRNFSQPLSVGGSCE